MLYTLLVAYLAATITYMHTVLLQDPELRAKFAKDFNDNWMLKATAMAPIVVGDKAIKWVKKKITK